MARTDDGIAYEDGLLDLPGGRKLAWRWWGEAGAVPVLRLQGTPGSRLFRHPDARLQKELGVAYLMADRPGFGGSTRKPGRGIADMADDLVALLDARGLDRVPVFGTSGGGPHALAIAARFPERISAASVVVGAVPLEPEEVAAQVGVNAKGYELAEKGWDALHEFLVEVRKDLLAVGLQGVLADAPEADRAIMSDPVWQRMAHANTEEAMRQGAEGWTDESMALHAPWDFDPGAIRTSVTWWHGDDDKNAPISAARRGARQVPGCDLRVWHAEGHFASIVHEKEIVAELISRR